jgi:hypothetical protein
MKIEKILCRIIFLWIIIIIYFIYTMFNLISDQYKSFFVFGPNDKLVIFGFNINTFPKYFIILTYCFINAIIRACYHNIITPWITNSIQDISKKKSKKIISFAYEVTFVSTIYNWFDWFIYLNILMSQVDMIIIEIIADLIATIGSTYYYINYNSASTTNNFETIPLKSKNYNYNTI